MENKLIGDNFLIWLNSNYDRLKGKLQAYCKDKGFIFDEDIFGETYLRIYETILKNGLKDSSDAGFENYLFKSFKLNLKREKQYSRVRKRNHNINDDDINRLYEEWFNGNNDSTKSKLVRDLWVDFTTLYILHKVDDNFDAEHFSLFRDKFLLKMTYKQLYKKYQDIKHIRDKVVNVQNWLKSNVNRNEIKEAFLKAYDDVINF